MATTKNDVPQFKQIQFIGIALSTTPLFLTSIDGYSDDGVYSGYEDDIDDISARIYHIKKTLSKIVCNQTSVNSDSSVLKVVVFPEFLMRGARGAYLRDNLLPFIQDILNLSDRNDIIVVLGSILSSDFLPSDETDFYKTGDNLLNIYYRLHQNKTARERLHNLLRRADAKIKLSEENGDDEFDDILVKTLDYSDLKATQIIDNRCYIVTPTFSKTVLKKFKSKEDFILNSDKTNITPLFLQTTTKYADIVEDNDVNGSVFTYGGIKFGIEICLDHKRQRLKNANVSSLDVQIIPSCGMTIKPESVVVRKGGYVFNCDGEYELANISEGVDGWHSHTSLRRLEEPAQSPGEAPKLSDAYSVAEKIENVNSEMLSLYGSKTYYIHVYPTVTLE